MGLFEVPLPQPCLSNVTSLPPASAVRRLFPESPQHLRTQHRWGSLCLLSLCRVSSGVEGTLARQARFPFSAKTLLSSPPKTSPSPPNIIKLQSVEACLVFILRLRLCASI